MVCGLWNYVVACRYIFVRVNKTREVLKVYLCIVKGSNPLFWANPFFLLKIKNKFYRFIICKQKNQKWGKISNSREEGNMGKI